MIDIDKTSFFYFWNVAKRFWYLIIGGMVVGVICGILFCSLVQPLYRSEARLFIWNQYIADAARGITDSSEGDGSSSQNMLMYNTLVTGAITTGPRLVEDFRRIFTGDSFYRQVSRQFPEKTFLKLEANAGRQSNIIDVAVVSTSPETAQAAATIATHDFERLQEELMGVKFVNIIQAPELPQKSFFPNWSKVIVIFAIFGFVVGSGLALLLSYIDFSIKTPEDVEQLGVLCLGGISARSDIGNHLQLSEYGTDRASRTTLEELSLIKTNLYHRNIENPQNTILISGDMPGIGKSTIALLLAQVLGNAENRVLLIDCDLRKPSLARKLGCFPPRGLVGLLLSLSSGADPRDYIVENVFPNVDFIAAGQTPRRPVDFFESRQFTDLLELMSKQYRYIILDGPPAPDIADSFLIASKVDGVIFVNQYGRSRIDRMKSLLGNWSMLSDKILGVIISKRTVTNESYYYSSDNQEGGEKSRHKKRKSAKA